MFKVLSSNGRMFYATKMKFKSSHLWRKFRHSFKSITEEPKYSKKQRTNLLVKNTKNITSQSSRMIFGKCVLIQSSEEIEVLISWVHYRKWNYFTISIYTELRNFHIRWKTYSITENPNHSLYEMNQTLNDKSIVAHYNPHQRRRCP